MKHISNFKLFESIDDVMLELKDIFLELEDAGFRIGLSNFYDEYESQYCLLIDIRKLKISVFKVNDIIDELNRANEYIETKGYFFQKYECINEPISSLGSHRDNYKFDLDNNKNTFYYLTITYTKNNKNK